MSSDVSYMMKEEFRVIEVQVRKTSDIDLYGTCHSVRILK